MLLNEDSAAGTTGNEDIYQNFFICLNYETRKIGDKANSVGLYIQYGIQIDSDETSHLYMSYFDLAPLDPVYYSFGSRNADVQILNAHIEPFNVAEQIKLRCKMSTTMNKALETFCDYECHETCEGCTKPYNRFACKTCVHASINLSSLNSSLENSTANLICIDRCPIGYQPDLNDEHKLCQGIVNEIC
jgi:hypothetical protein